VSYVSSDKQAKEGDSIPAQLDALNKYANERKYEIIGTFVDDGISGTKSDRDELQKLLSLVEQDKVDIIIFTKLDRWFRSIRHYINTQVLLDAHGVNWTAIWEPIYDTTTPQGRLIVNQMMSIAQFEAEQTGQRVRQVQEHKLRQREVISGTVPRGYSIVNKHLVPNEDADDVRKAFETYDRTGNLSKTVEAMVGTNLPETVTGMKRMLKNRRYIGEAHGITDFCEPIVDRELFDRVQIALGRNIKRSQKRTYMFSGLMRCAECGRPMSGHYWVARDCLGYRCQKHYGPKVDQCPNSRIITDGVIEERLLNMLPNVIVEQVEVSEKKKAPVVSYEKQKAALEKKIERLKILFVNEEISLEEYRVDKATLMKQIEELAPVTPPEPPQAILALQGMDVKAIYEILTKEEKRAFWRGIIKEIRFDKDRNLFFEFL
jgi:DNA invertase Pin-like site-specific DNA recombinase